MNFQSRIIHSLHILNNLLGILTLLNQINSFLVCGLNTNKNKPEACLLHKLKRYNFLSNWLHITAQYYFLITSSLEHFFAKFTKPLANRKSTAIIERLPKPQINKVIDFFNDMSNRSKSTLLS